MDQQQKMENSRYTANFKLCVLVFNIILLAFCNALYIDFLCGSLYSFVLDFKILIQLRGVFNILMENSQNTLIFIGW